MSDGKKKKINVGTIKGYDLAKATMPVFQVNFKTGGYITQKDRPRDKNWRKWVME